MVAAAAGMIDGYGDDYDDELDYDKDDYRYDLYELYDVAGGQGNDSDDLKHFDDAVAPVRQQSTTSSGR